jgi:plastocyanin
MKRSAVIALPLLALALAACGGSSKSTSSAATTPATSTAAASGTTASSTAAASTGSTVEVTMKNLAFSPDTVHAKVGQTIKWTNDDSPPHNVTYVSGPKFTSSTTMNPGATFSLKLTQAGTIHYFCSIHPFMKATIVVSQ